MITQQFRSNFFALMTFLVLSFAFLNVPNRQLVPPAIGIPDPATEARDGLESPFTRDTGYPTPSEPGDFCDSPFENYEDNELDDFQSLHSCPICASIPVQKCVAAAVQDAPLWCTTDDMGRHGAAQSTKESTMSFSNLDPSDLDPALAAIIMGDSSAAVAESDKPESDQQTSAQLSVALIAATTPAPVVTEESTEETAEERDAGSGGSTMLIEFVNDATLDDNTNILDIEVPAMLELSIDTGIPWVNDAFGGNGITPSMVTMITGTPGAGKSTLMMQLADASQGVGHNVLYNMGEESIYQLRKSTRRMRLQNGFIVGKDRLIDDVLNHSDRLAARNPKALNVLIIDSLQAHDDGFYKDGHTNSMTPVRVMEKLTEFAKATYTAIVVVGQVTKDGTFEGKQKIIHMIDAKGEICFDDNRKSETYGKRIFQMTKNRFGVSGRHYVLDIDEEGLKEIGTM